MNPLKNKEQAPVQRPAISIQPAPGNYAAAGDFLRVFCCFMVAWYHIWQQSWLSPNLIIAGRMINLTPPVRAGYMFVDMMLLLSGFLIYLPYANHKEDPARTFYMKRALRILPSYWFCLLIMLGFGIAQYGFKDATLWKDLAAHLGFVHNFFQFSYTGTRMNVVLWTLAVEVQFYLLAPALAPAFRKRPLACYIAMVAMGTCFRRLWTMPMANTTLFVNRLPNMLDIYANGMMAAHIYAKLAKMDKHRLKIAAIATILCIAGAWGAFEIIGRQARTSGYDQLRAGQLHWRWLFSACGALFLAGGSLSFKPLRTLLSNKPVRFLSGVSFNFYIWHQWLAVKLKAWHIPGYVNELPNQASEMPWQLHYTLICFFGALALAIAVTYLIEKPCTKWGRKLMRKREKSLETDAPA